MAGSRIAKTTAIFTRRHAAVTLVVNVSQSQNYWRNSSHTKSCASVSEGSRPPGVSRFTVSGSATERRLTISSRDRPVFWASSSMVSLPIAVSSSSGFKSRFGFHRDPRVCRGALPSRTKAIDEIAQAFRDVTSRISRAEDLTDFLHHATGASRDGLIVRALRPGRIVRPRSSRVVCPGSDNPRQLPAQAAPAMTAYLLPFVHPLDGRFLRPTGNETPGRQNHDGPDRRSDQTGSFVWPIPSKALPKEGRYESSDDAEDCREDKSRRLIPSRHKEFRDNASQKADNDRPDDAH